MPQNTSTPALPRRHTASPREERSGDGPPHRPQPLLQLHAHWQTRAHRRYLEAANFHWPH